MIKCEGKFPFPPMWRHVHLNSRLHYECGCEIGMLHISSSENVPRSTLSRNCMTLHAGGKLLGRGF